MFLIKAEANLNQNNIEDAQTALLVVAKRNTAITSVADLPSSATELKQFIKDERARELFQEGLRLWDLRRWGQPANFAAQTAPSVDYAYANFDATDLVFPIPNSEITTGYGVEQNDWSSVMPK
jgi:hypothetical protein